MSFVRKTEIEKLLIAHWSSFLDGPQIMKQALIDARNASYTKLVPGDFKKGFKTGVTISKFDITNKGQIEIWVEFTVQREEDAVVGSHIYEIDLLGNFELKATFGTIFSLGEKNGQ